jgi:WD40 repeat protein
VVGLECERPEQCQDSHAGEVRQQQQTEGDALQKHVPEDIVGRSADQRTYVREAQPTLDQAIRTAEASHKPVWRVEHGGSVSIAAFSPDGRLVLTTPSDKTARVFEAATDKELDAPGSKAVARIRSRHRRDALQRFSRRRLPIQRARNAQVV